MGRRLEAWRGQGTAREDDETGGEEEEQHLLVCFRVTGRDGWLGVYLMGTGGHCLCLYNRNSRTYISPSVDL